ncbi:AfsR/SARP family transcriptional regulator [Nonomuraea sp. NBC_01738]|uniref:BTAD domain-containing putative transcriptional regulator n=1 Tax=Nonomuraea sp. NBC_01738 TaxID=2976003 RepID=UPI002E11753D|nr:AfsR/SARP family transcriptional regulator [Nonomuraea sp. NBC_01738]
MRFGVLGGVRAWRDDGSELPLGGPARRALLAAFLLRPGHLLTPAALIDELYGTRPPADAHHALQSQISRLRRDGIMVERATGGYRLDIEPEAVDVHRFVRLADEGRARLESGDPAGAGALLREALLLWRSPAPAVHLEERHLAALGDRIEADLRTGGQRAAIVELEALTRAHPLRERLHGQLMRALAADGRQAEALAAFERARVTLADELGTDPSPELAALHQALLRGEIRAAETRRAPAPLTTFVGRDADAAEVAALLTRARLVTLLGPGGVGKTRLATEVMRGLPGEVVVVELAGVRDGGELAQVALGALGVRDGGLRGLAEPVNQKSRLAEPVNPMSRLVSALAERSLLLVLDNCEQIIGDVATAAELLLTACPALRILATSREPLGVTAEHLWPVRPLDPADAVTLFTDRAAAVRPGFLPDASVERICELLDGLPLAIELAAARVRTHDPAELAVRLQADRFPLLSRGSRTADARHRTLHAVVAWSWELLTPAERAMAARLTVFAGSASARAAAEVSGLPDAESLLDSLADKSLVEVAGGRYRMLATIRAFCADRLDDPTPVRQAHAAYFLRLARAADPHLRGGDQLRWLEILTAEHADLQEAVRWAIESGDPALGIRLVGAQAHYLWMRGMRTTTANASAALLELAGPDPDPELGDDYVLCALAAGAPALTRHERTAVAMLFSGRRHPLVTFLWPMMTAGGGDPEVPLAVLTRAEAGDDPWERTMARLIWGYPQMASGGFATAERTLGEALAGFRDLGDRWGTALALDGLAWLAATSGDTATALEHTEEALSLIEALGATEDLSDMLCNRGDLRQHHDPAGARADYEKSAELARHAAFPTYLAAALRGLGDLARFAGDLAGARALYTEALDRTDRSWVRSSGNLSRLLVGLGLVAQAEGDREAARAAYVEAIEVTIATGAVPESARAIEGLAGITDAAGLAATLLGAATSVRGIAVPAGPEVAATAARARAALGDAAYEHAHAAGARLSHLEALGLAGISPETISAAPLGVLSALGEREWGAPAGEPVSEQ